MVVLVGTMVLGTMVVSVGTRVVVVGTRVVLVEAEKLHRAGALGPAFWRRVGLSILFGPWLSTLERH